MDTCLFSVGLSFSRAR